MNEPKSILQLSRLPARLNAPQTAEVLGFLEHDIPVLIAAGLLKPLGRPAPNANKWFATKEILDLAEDLNWLSRATRAIYEFHQKRNGRNENLTARAKF